MKSQNSPETIPAKFAANEILSRAYRMGWNHGHGIACHNVPSLGDKVSPCVDWVGLGKTVTAENIVEYHSLLCHAAADNSRQFSPFEFTASELNGLEEGGWVVSDPDGNDVARFDTEAEAKADFSARTQAEAVELGASIAEAHGWAIRDVPSADEAWGAFEEGEGDAIAADLATYGPAEYGLPTEEEAQE